ATKDVYTRSSADEELQAQLLAAEEKRRERFESVEEERENLRQSIRDKYGIKKKEFLDIPDSQQRRRSLTPRHSVSSVAVPNRQIEEKQGP
ncbi:unnamed protein product, partial [Dicrocoelium dendriticum]